MQAFPCDNDHSSRNSPFIRPRTTAPDGVTLTELLVVITIIGVLAALLFAALGRASEFSKTAQCASNLHQLGVAAVGYAGDHNGDMPIGRGDVSYNLTGDALVWYDGLATYMGRPGPYANNKAVPLSAVFACPSNHTIHQKNGTADPAFPSWPYTGDYGYNYFLNSYTSGGGGQPTGGVLTKFSNLTRPSQALMICEVSYQNQFGTITTSSKKDSGLGMRHLGGDNMLWADGHVSRMTYEELKAMATDVNAPWKGNQNYFYTGIDAP